MIKTTLRRFHRWTCGLRAFKSRETVFDDCLQFHITAHGMWQVGRLLLVCGVLIYAIMSAWMRADERFEGLDVLAAIVAGLAWLFTFATVVPVCLDRGCVGSLHKRAPPVARSISADSVQTVELRAPAKRNTRNPGKVYLMLHYDERGGEAELLVYADEDAPPGHERAFEKAAVVLNWLPTDVPLVVDEKMQTSEERS